MQSTIPNFFRTKSGKAFHITSAERSFNGMLLADNEHVALCGQSYNDSCVGIETPAEDTKLCANCEKAMNEQAAKDADQMQTGETIEQIFERSEEEKAQGMLAEAKAQEPAAPALGTTAEYYVNFADQGGNDESYVQIFGDDRAAIIEAVAKIARRVPADRFEQFLCDVVESASAHIGNVAPNDLLQDAFKKRVRN